MLDLLLARGENIDQVVVVYLAHYPRSRVAFKRLADEFSDGNYQNTPCRFRGVPIQAGQSDLVDIRTPEEVESVHQNIHQLLSDLKEQRQLIHLGLGGGRRLISLIALAAAMQYLSPVDRLWHIHVPLELSKQSPEQAMLHAPADADVHLVPVPFVPWVSYFPGLGTLLNRSLQEVGESSVYFMAQEERDRCRRVWEKLTARQKRVLEEYAQGLSRQEVARKLNVTEGTVSDHRDSILVQCKLVWETQDGLEFQEKFLQQRFGPFLSGLISF
jgi:CRISPR-associated protein (TIGR02584 family)